MKSLLMLAVMLLSGCATTKKPTAPYKPSYIYMVLYGKFRAYPIADRFAPEKDVKDASIIGSMCLSPDDFAAQEKYIMQLEAYSGVR